MADGGRDALPRYRELGFDSDANRIANEAKLVSGQPRLRLRRPARPRRLEPARFTVTVDGERRELTGYSVAVGNSKAYGGGMYLAPHAVLDDGQLDVLMSSASSKLRFLASLPKVFKGTHLDSPSVHVMHGQRVEVAADRPFDVYADGDPSPTCQRR